MVSEKKDKHSHCSGDYIESEIKMERNLKPSLKLKNKVSLNLIRTPTPKKKIVKAGLNLIRTPTPKRTGRTRLQICIWLKETSFKEIENKNRF